MTTARPDAGLGPGRGGALDVLLLQGPVGPFFDDLARALAAHGLRVGRMTFNRGDRLFCRAGEPIRFTGAIGDWPERLRDLLAARSVRLVVLFGDGRPLHAAAVAVCKRLGVPVWCLEEGYIRPGFVALEPGGNNARSPLAGVGPSTRLPASIPPEPDPGTNELLAMALTATAQHIAAMIGPAAWRGIVHRHRPLAREGWRWIGNALLKLRRDRPDAALAASLCEAHPGRFFLVALQVHDDMQLLRYGRGWTMERVVSETVASFAAHAPDGARLVFKVHPLDRAHRPYRRWIGRAARAHAALEGRVHVVETGPIAPLLRQAAGLVTVNSTAGLSGLHHGRPVLALGEAFYAGEGLARAALGVADLDGFWRRPAAPDPAAWSRLRSAMLDRALVPGAFYGRAVRLRTARRVAERLASTLRGPDVSEAERAPAVLERQGIA